MARNRTIEDAPAVKALFGSTSLAWLWIAPRLYLGWNFLESGWNKLFNPAWMETGLAVKGAWTKAVVVPETGNPQITYDWYREFINFLLVGGHHAWFAKFMVLGEIAVGLGLIVGCLTGIAAFFAALMNWNFLMLGIISVNPVWLPIGIALVAAWKTAGYYGLDRWLLPALGTPWQPGEIFERNRPPGAIGPQLPALPR